ncbi:HNH endonuclease [Marinifilum flexuosum]|uniref:HNH endonuclease n=1 Tax=Marinifilum flexuosum TaxID=1117708 RepID=UPI000E71E85C|nr:HNH endonuclease [Marinifilum flexuosum]
MAIEIHGVRCMVPNCSFDFEEHYGLHGKDYIEVHHIKPLSSIKEETKVNPKTDMVVVCSNCHRMIHRKKNEVLSIEKLNELLSNKINTTANSGS